MAHWPMAHRFTAYRLVAQGRRPRHAALTVLSTVFAAAALLLVEAARSPAGAVEPEAVFRHVATDGTQVNSYLIETGNTVVLIDAQGRLSEADKIVQTIRTLGKPLRAVIITHAHPSQYAGLPRIIEAFPDALIYATEETRREMAFDPNGLMEAHRDLFPNDLPEFIPQPNRLLTRSDRLSFDGVRLDVMGLGAGEADDMIVVFIRDGNRLFVGDLISPGITPYMGAGRTQFWIAQLQTLMASFSRQEPTVFPAHGQPGPFLSLVRDQMAELLILRHFVGESIRLDLLGPDDLRAIERAYTDLYPAQTISGPFDDQAIRNVIAVARELGADLPEDPLQPVVTSSPALRPVP